jgi:hypothetical protein
MRKNRRSAQLKLRARIVLEGGDTFHVHRPLELTAQDSRLIIESDPLSSLGPATISGGERLELTMRPLDTAEERAWFGPHAAQHVLKAVGRGSKAASQPETLEAEVSSASYGCGGRPMMILGLSALLSLVAYIVAVRLAFPGARDDKFWFYNKSTVCICYCCRVLFER